MACTTLTVTAPVNPTVTISNVGFGDNLTKFTVCSTVPGKVINVYADYVIGNPGPAGTNYRISGDIYYISPTLGAGTYAFNVSTTSTTGTFIIGLTEAYSAGNYTALAIQNPTITVV